MDFEWDALKELENIKKHKVPFIDAIESFIDPTMKQPKMSDLVIDRKGTKRMRAEIAKTKKVKITINH